MKPKHVRLFVKHGCPWCEEAEDWLNERRVPHKSLDVLIDGEARREMIELSDQTKAPVIEIDGKVLADFDTDQLAAFWKSLGYVDSIE